MSSLEKRDTTLVHVGARVCNGGNLIVGEADFVGRVPSLQTALEVDRVVFGKLAENSFARKRESVIASRGTINI